MITLETVIALGGDQISRDLDDETVILNLTSGTYYGLDPIGAQIWRWLGRPRPLRELRDRLIEDYDVAPDRCERDLLLLVQRLLDEGLVRPVDQAR
jgi:hypothetical protein